jgi:outer membrane immunogenic protein
MKEITLKTLLISAAIVLAPNVAGAQDWSGFYGVLGAANASGVQEEFGVIVGPDDLDGQLASVGFGYNTQSGSWVFGGEMTVSTGDVDVVGLPSGNYLDGFIDVKGRVGYAIGKVLMYGTLGYGTADRYFGNPLVTNEPISASGMSYGVGVDVLMSNRFFAGIEYLHRNLDIGEGELAGFPTSSYEHDVKTVGLRIGIKF